MIFKYGPSGGGESQISPWAIVRLISWAFFITIAYILVRKKKMNEKTAWILSAFSTLINGFLLGAFGNFPNPVHPIQNTVLGNFNPLFIVILVVLLGLSLILGRFFCGYACPVGVFQEFLWRVREILFKQKVMIKLNPKLVQSVRAGAFILMIILALIVSPAISLFGLINPFEFFEVAKWTWTTTMIISLCIFIFSLFMYRPFCRLLCPFGFLANLISRIPKMSDHWIREEGCSNCQLCEKLCPSNDYSSKKNHGECYLCGRCSTKCPKKVLTYKSVVLKPQINETQK